MIIKPCSYAEIMAAPNFAELIAEYGAECSIPEIGPINPQADLYALMDSSGLTQEFGAYEGETLVGFMAIQVFVLPHYGRKIANVESLFVPQSRRASGIGLELLRIARAYGKHRGCVTIVYNAPVGSVLEQLLSARKQSRRTNSVFCEAL